MLAEKIFKKIQKRAQDLEASGRRLAQRADAEALHDLRVTLRELRSLLRPLRKEPAVASLEGALKDAADLTTPLRDTEVLVQELVSLGAKHMSEARKKEWNQGVESFLRGPEWQSLRAALTAWPEVWEKAQGAGELRGLRKRLCKSLAKDRRRLRKALREPSEDRHRLRLLIKRVRYSSEAYNKVMGLSKKVLAQLKEAQTVLGEWHDREVWLEKAKVETDLKPLITKWTKEFLEAEKTSDQVLSKINKKRLSP